MSRQILIIDDSATRRIMMKARLAAAQYHVMVATDLQSAIDLLSQTTFDAIFVDEDLAFSDETANDPWQSIRHPGVILSTPLILMSDAPSAAHGITALGSGFEDVLVRPFQEKVLLAKLRAIMRRRARFDSGKDYDFLSELPTNTNVTVQKSDIVIAAPNLVAAQRCADLLSCLPSDGLKSYVAAASYGNLLRTLDTRLDPDVILLVVGHGQEDTSLTLLSDIRSHPTAGDVGVIVSMDISQPSAVARAFDLGADYVVPASVSTAELAIRIGRLTRGKMDRETLRSQIRDGLRMAITDPLTGVYNRRFATEKLTQIANGQDEFAVLMLDLDHFKRINDQHGHGVGDQVLTTIANALKANLRDGDLLARIGGEEFLIALPGATPKQAACTAERLRTVISQVDIRAPITNLPVRATLSIGLVHNTDPGAGIDTLMAKADAALYRAKSDGRNMVSISKAA